MPSSSRTSTPPLRAEKYLDELALRRSRRRADHGRATTPSARDTTRAPRCRLCGRARSRPARPGPISPSSTPRVTPPAVAAPVLGRCARCSAPAAEMSGTTWSATPGPQHGAARAPGRNAPSGAPMPCCAGRYGSGRTIALTVDGSHRLLFSAFAASAAGRAHGAFWTASSPGSCATRATSRGGRGMGGCRPARNDAGAAPGARTRASQVKVTRLGSPRCARVKAPLRAGEAGTRSRSQAGAGGYASTVEIGDGDKQGPTTRRDFACERGVDEWADSRPRLGPSGAIARGHGASTWSPATPARCRCRRRRRWPPSATRARWRRRGCGLWWARVFLGAHWISAAAAAWTDPVSADHLAAGDPGRWPRRRVGGHSFERARLRFEARRCG